MYAFLFVIVFIILVVAAASGRGNRGSAYGAGAVCTNILLYYFYFYLVFHRLYNGRICTKCMGTFYNVAIGYWRNNTDRWSGNGRPRIIILVHVQSARWGWSRILIVTCFILKLIQFISTYFYEIVYLFAFSYTSLVTNKCCTLDFKLILISWFQCSQS